MGFLTVSARKQLKVLLIRYVRWRGKKFTFGYHNQPTRRDMSMLNRPNLIREGAVLALLLLVAQMPTASAQVQRSFLNLSFEEPPIPGSNCFSIRVSWEFPEYAGGTPTVPGWRTTETHLGSWASNTTGSCGGHPPEPPARGGLQIFKAPFQSTEAADGVQFAELNAFTPSRLFQTVCLMEGDVVDWYLHHKARSNLTGGEEFEFNISPILKVDRARMTPAKSYRSSRPEQAVPAT